MRFCEPHKVAQARLIGFMAAYAVVIAAAWSNPARLAPHTASMLLQGANVAALVVLIGVVVSANRKAGCGSKWTWTWVTAAVLGGNLVARLASAVRLRATGRDSDNHAAKYVRWDKAAAAIGTVATLTELYFAVVPRQRFRILFFVLALVFGLPAITVAFDMFRVGRPDVAVLRECLKRSAAAYDLYDGKAHNRVLFHSQGDSLFVAFAGTETSKDVKVDASIGDVVVPGEWTGGAVSRAHAGFVKMYASLRGHVHENIQRLAPAKSASVIFTGHSLGGALATLAAIDAASNAVSGSVKVVTFGAPPVGDSNFARAFNSTVAECVRVANPYDPITTLPSTQFIHTKGYFPVASFTRDFPATAHSLSTYALALDRPRWVQYIGLFAPAGYLAAAVGVVALWHVIRRASA